MAQMPRDSERICLGAIASPHGVRGMVRVKPFTENPQDIAAYGPVLLDDGRSFDLNLHGTTKGLVMVKLMGIDSRDEAEQLKGERLYVLREQLPAPHEDEVYQADLIGLDVHDPELGLIGRVAAVFDFGAGAMVEVRRKQGKAVLLPFGDNNPITIEDGIMHLNVDPIWLEDEAKADG